MSDGTLVPMGAIKAAMTRLQEEELREFPEFWVYLAEEIDAREWTDG